MRLKPYLMLAIALIVLCGTAMAQEAAPKAEIFGGYAYMRTAANTNVNGWNAQGAFYANRWFGVAIDFAGHYQTQSDQPVTPSAGLYSILAGPQFVDRAGKVSGFTHVLLGVAHVSKGFQLLGGGVQGGSNGLVMAFGGGIDVNVNEKLAVRVFQADYEKIRTKNNFTFQVEGTNNFRLSMGLVLKVK
jgi:hypothetical protein